MCTIFIQDPGRQPVKSMGSRYRCVQTAIRWGRGQCIGARKETGGCGGNVSWSLSAGAVPGLSL